MHECEMLFSPLFAKVGTCCFNRCDCPNFSEPNLPALQKFPYKDGDIDIISETAGCYKRIGIFLLNDKTGGIVNVITMEHSKPEDKMTAIYERWLQKGASWEQLIQVLKDCNLHVLANNIEEGLKGKCIHYNEANMVSCT